MKMFGDENADDLEDDIEAFMDAMDKSDMEKAKRRFINSLIQGASKKGHYMFNLVREELDRLDPRLLNLYGVLMSIADLMYWIIPDEMTQMMAGEGEGVQGSEEVDDTTDPPTIKAKGLFFPVLLHDVPAVSPCPAGHPPASLLRNHGACAEPDRQDHRRDRQCDTLSAASGNPATRPAEFTCHRCDSTGGPVT